MGSTVQRSGSSAGGVAGRLALALVPLLLAATLTGSGGAEERRPDAIVLFTGSVHGFLEECGCESFPLGGLDRRAGYLRQLRREERGVPRLLLDVGNFSDETGPAGLVKTRRLLDAMGRLGYQASGIGPRDLAWDPALLQDLLGRRPFPLLGANLVREATGEPWLEPFALAPVGELRVGIVALAAFDPALRLSLGDGDALVPLDPKQGLERALEGLRGRADLVVLLAALPLEEARLLVRSVPGVDLVLGSFGDLGHEAAFREGGTKILYCGQEGQLMGRIDVYVGAEGELRSFREDLISLDDSIPSEPAMEAFVVEGMVEAQEAERAALAKLRSEIAGAPREGPTYLGSGSCTACHADVVAEWSESRHRHAWESLERRPSAFKESCVACHVTGYGEPSGYFDGETTPHLQEVGCESCHGPASEHVRRPEIGYGSISIASCTGCHDAANDPDFDYARDKRLVSHRER